MMFTYTFGFMLNAEIISHLHSGSRYIARYLSDLFLPP